MGMHDSLTRDAVDLEQAKSLTGKLSSIVRDNGMEAEMQTLVTSHASVDQLFEITAKIACCTSAEFAISLITKEYRTQKTNDVHDALYEGQTARGDTDYAVAKLKEALLLRFANAYVTNSKVTQGVNDARLEVGKIYK